MNDLKLSRNELEQYKTLLQDWIPNDASIVIALDTSYVFTSQSNHHIHLELQDEVHDESITAQVLKTRRKTELILDDSIFGKPYFTIGYPIYIDRHEAALILILPSTYTPDKHEPYKFLTGKQNDDWTPIPIEQISHIESLQKRTWLYTGNDQFKSSITLKELQTRLPDYFVRIHRSYILNVYYVKKIAKDIASNFVIVLKNDIELPVSQSYIHDLRKLLEF